MLRTCRTSSPLSSHCEPTLDSSSAPPRPSLSSSSTPTPLGKKNSSSAFHSTCCRASLRRPPRFSSHRFRCLSLPFSANRIVVSSRPFFPSISFFYPLLLLLFLSSSLPLVLPARPTSPVSSSPLSPAAVSSTSEAPGVEPAVEGVGFPSKDDEEEKLLTPRNEESLQETGRRGEEKEKTSSVDRAVISARVDTHASKNTLERDVQIAEIPPDRKDVDGDRHYAIRAVEDSDRAPLNREEEETTRSRKDTMEDVASSNPHGRSRSPTGGMERDASEKISMPSIDNFFRKKEEGEGGPPPSASSSLGEEEEEDASQEALRKGDGDPRFSRPFSGLLLRMKRAASLRKARSSSPSSQLSQSIVKEEDGERREEQEQEEKKRAEGSRDVPASSPSSSRSFNLYEESASQVFEGVSAMRRRLREEQEEALARRRRKRSSVYLFGRRERPSTPTWTTRRDRRAFRHFKLKLLVIAFVSLLYILWRPDARLERRILSRQVFRQRLRHLLGSRRPPEQPVSLLTKLIIFSPVFSIALSLLTSSVLFYYRSSQPASPGGAQKLVLRRHPFPI